MSPSRCSCKGTLPDSCNCTISDTSTIDVSGAGSSGSPYALAPDLAAAPGLLSCETNGFKGKWPDRVLSPPRARVWRNSDQLIDFPGPGIISFNTEIYDTGGFWSPGSPTRLTNTLGFTALFGIGISASLQLGVAYDEQTWLLEIGLNGSGSLAADARPIVTGRYNSAIAPASLVPLDDNLTVYSEFRLANNDYVEVFVSSSTSIDRPIKAKPRLSPIFTMTYLSD